MDRIMHAVQRLQGFPIVERCSMEEILYDEQGMPK
jgi:hypothetical protein